MHVFCDIIATCNWGGLYNTFPLSGSAVNLAFSQKCISERTHYFGNSVLLKEYIPASWQRFPRCFQIFPDAPRLRPDFSVAPTISHTPLDIPRYSQMLPVVASCSQMLSGAPWCSQMFRRSSKMFPDVDDQEASLCFYGHAPG